MRKLWQVIHPGIEPGIFCCMQKSCPLGLRISSVECMVTLRTICLFLAALHNQSEGPHKWKTRNVMLLNMCGTIVRKGFTWGEDTRVSCCLICVKPKKIQALIPSDPSRDRTWRLLLTCRSLIHGAYGPFCYHPLWKSALYPLLCQLLTMKVGAHTGRRHQSVMLLMMCGSSICKGPPRWAPGCY